MTICAATRRLARPLAAALACGVLLGPALSADGAGARVRRHSSHRYMLRRGALPALPSRQAPLRYGGGRGGIGVETAPAVYVVFWGSQWGAVSAQGEDVALSRDPLGVAPYLQQFLRGLGGPLDAWSTSTTQYCQGIARRARTCSPADVFVTHPAGSLLAGVWADVDAPAPSAPTAADLGREAARAAEHFGNLDPLVNASAQYVVASAHGVRPDGFPAAGYCAWHDRTSGASVRVASAMGDLAFVNLPYVPDAGKGCGQGFVNGRSGALDGVSLVAGHELAETITDPLPPAGWVDRQGAENADKCAWIRSGPGAAADLAFGTGIFPVQSLWSNDAVGGAGSCVLSYAGPADEH